MKLNTLPTLLCWLCLSSTALLTAQSEEAPKWGDIPNKDLAMTMYDKDTAATAVVLLDYGTQELTLVSGTPESLFYHYKRIKILDRKAIDDLGNVTISYYHAERRENVYGLKAQTIAPDGSVKKLNNRDFFEEKVNDYWTRVSFALPDIQVGSVLEYQYSLRSESVFQPPTWYFRGSYPVRYSQYKFVNNLPFTYIYLLQGSDYMEKLPTTGGADIYQIGEMRLRINQTQFAATNIPALPDDDYVICPDDYRTKVRFQLYEVVKGGFKERIMQTWPEIAKELDDRDDFGSFLKRDRFSKNLSDAIMPQVEEAADPLDKVKTITRLLRAKIKSSGNRGIIPDVSPDDQLAAGIANVPDLTLSAVRLYIEAGLEAYPVMTSTRDHGGLLPKHVLVDQFNYLLAAVRISEEWVFVDLGDSALPVGWVSPPVLGRLGLLLNGEATQWIELPTAKDVRIIAGDLVLQEDGQLAGEVRLNYRDYGSYLEQQRQQHTSSKETWEKRLTTIYPMATLGELTWEIPTTVADPLSGSFDLTIADAALVNDNYMYLSPCLYSSFRTNAFKATERTFPVDFPYPHSERLLTKIALPAGWEVSELPEPMRLTLRGSGVTFQYNIQVIEQFLQLNVYIDVDQMYYSPTLYPQLRELLDRVANKISEQIVLKKI